MSLSPGYEKSDEQRYEKQASDAATASQLTTDVEPFSPRKGLRRAHVQTIASHLLPRRDALPSPQRRVFNIEDGVQVLCLCHWQFAATLATTLVIVHGLEGSSDSQYVIGTANKAWDAGVNVVRMNVRNCGGTESLCRTLYHSGLSGDIDVVVRELIRREALTRVVLAGFSMGGNQVLKLAGEWGAAAHEGAPEQVRAIAVVSPAIDLSLSADALHLPSNRIYEWRFLWSLRQRLRRKLRLFPGSLQVDQWWWPSLRDFDNLVTAPHCGFIDVDDYYDQASASRVIDRITLPTLILHSKDDPFIRVSEPTRAKILANPCVTFVETEHGGHCAFLAPADGYDGRWAERQILTFLQKYAI